MSFRELYQPTENEPIDFDHVAVQDALVNGWGQTAHATRQRVNGIVNALERMDHDLSRTLARGSWTHARERDNTTPLTNAVEALREISESFEDILVTQGEEFRRVRAMPARVEVEALDANLVSPGSGPGSEAGRSAGAFLLPCTDKELDECAANHAEEQARERYRDYQAALTVDRGHSVDIPRVPQEPGKSASGKAQPGTLER